MKRSWQTRGGDTENLAVLDKRHVEDALGMFEAIIEQLELHVKERRHVVTVFRQRRPGLVDLRVWNRFLLQVMVDQSDLSTLKKVLASLICSCFSMPVVRITGILWESQTLLD